MAATKCASLRRPRGDVELNVDARPRLSRWTLAAMLLAVLALCLVNMVIGETIPAGEGLGYDGLVYGNMVLELPALIREGRLNHYYAQRILPSAIVRWGMLAAGSELTVPAIIRAFRIYNLLLLLGVCWVWVRLVRASGLGNMACWFGFCALVLNFSMSRLSFYYPVLTDVTALFTGMLLLLFALQRRAFPLFVTAVIGAFGWQVIGLYGAMLLLGLCVDRSERASDAKPPSHAGSASASVWAFSLGLGLAAYVAVLATRIGIGSNKLVLRWNVSVDLPRLESLITGIPSLLAVVIAVAILLQTSAVDLLARRLRWQWRPAILIMAGLTVLVPMAVTRLIANATLANPSSFATVLGYVLHPPSGKFLLPFVSIVVFWGPAALFMLFCWRQLCGAAGQLGPGVIGVLALSLPLALATEPRFVTAAWPFAVYAMVLSLRGLLVHHTAVISFALLSMFFAHFWLPLNWGRWPTPDHADLLEFPKQIYFLHFGYWMGWPAFVAQSLMVLAAGWWIRYTLVNPAASRDGAANAGAAASLGGR